MNHFLSMKKTIILAAIITTTFYNSIAQKNSFMGNWQYLDNDSTYNELTISGKYLYRYSDSSEPVRIKIKLTKNTISFKGKIWTIKHIYKGKVEIYCKQGTINLYRLPDNDNAVEDFYDWYSEPHNGNGVMIYWQEAADRKASLLRKIKKEI